MTQQTERTLAAVQALLADNASEDISPQDVRDAIASVAGGYASLILTISGAPVTMIGVAQTPVVIAEYDLLASQSIDANIDGHSADLVTGSITVGEAGIYFQSFFASFSLSTNNKIIHFQPHTNNAVGLLEVDRFVGSAGDVGVIAMHTVVPYAKGDVVDMRVLIDSGTADLTLEAMAFCMFRVG